MPRHVLFAAAAAVLAIAPLPALAQPPSRGQVQDSSTVPPPTLTPAAGPDFPRGAISGHAFVDYYYDVAGDPRHAYNASGADSGLTDLSMAATALGGPKNVGRDLNGIVIRRVYFQLDNDLTIKYVTRFRLEVDSKSLASDGKIGVAVKAAYLKVRSAIPRGDFSFGMLDTPTWYESEDFWQYRSIEKTLADFRGIGTRADLGAALKGYLDDQHRLGYFAMLGNGTGQKPETNRYKKYYLSLPLKFGDLHVAPYVDYENVPGGQDKATYMVFAGYEFRRVALGVEALDRANHRPAGGNQQPAGVSLFARGAAIATVGAFARFDYWVPDRGATNRVDSQLWIAGLDWRPLKNVHVMPNVEATQYRARGSAVAPGYHDLQARLTFYYLFSKPQS